MVDERFVEQLLITILQADQIQVFFKAVGFAPDIVDNMLDLLSLC